MKTNNKNKNKKKCYLYKKMERGIIMVVHSLLLGVLLYLIMIYVLGQRPVVAENRSIIISAYVLIYMVMFGHGLPNKLNKDLF